jgi:hypothetical protein
MDIKDVITIEDITIPTQDISSMDLDKDKGTETSMEMGTGTDTEMMMGMEAGQTAIGLENVSEHWKIWWIGMALEQDMDDV